MPHEFLLDRCIGRRSAEMLRAEGLVVHQLADIYPDDAQDVADEAWIAEGSKRGLIMLTRDGRIRYRAHELRALTGQLFCLANGNLSMAATSARFVEAMPAIQRIADQGEPGFWKVYDKGRVERVWP